MSNASEPASNSPLMSDVSIRPEYIGLEVMLCPFPQHISSQRSAMLASNITQALVLEGNEYPQISTGYEKKFMQYDFNPTKRENDIQIIEVIPKFQPQFGRTEIKANPMYTIIYRDCNTGKVDYFDLSNFTALYDGFGYLNKHSNKHLLKKDSFVPKDVQFSTTPNHDGNLYGMGTNANVAFMPMWETTEDAFVISETLAEKTAHQAIATVEINIDKDSIPLNLYGSADNYKTFPDIDEIVGENGIIMGIRSLDESSYLADTTNKALSEPEYAHDDLFVAPAGARVLDVKVYCTNRTYRLVSQGNGAFEQLMKYQEHHHMYYDKIVELYHHLSKQNMKMGSKLNNLITRCMHLRMNKSKANGRKSIRLMNKRDPVDFITVQITYGYRREVSKGFKFTGRDGAKGVVSAVWPDKDMPVDEQGIRADIIISPESAFNRMNPAQLYEQFYNRASSLIQQRLINGELGDTNAAFDYIVSYITDCRKVYGDYLKSHITTSDQKEQFLMDVEMKGIYLIIPPFCKEIGPEQVLSISEKYNIIESPVTYNQKLSDGRVKPVTTKKPVCIGSKYIYLLGKIPLSMMSSVQMGYINQFGTPAKPERKSIKAQYEYSQTPIRFGEDEVCMLTMSVGSDAVSRFIGTRASSPTAINKLGVELLTNPNPTKLNRIDMDNKEITQNNVNIGIFTHMMGAVGYDVCDTAEGRK